MYELPLFPLNTVLFPGMPLKLHIFEERYKLMINRCYGEGIPFGVALIKSGREVGGRAEPVAVGCTAVITEVEPLVGGRMNITAVGHERFQIKGFKYDEPYLIGLVENYPLTELDSDTLRSSGRSLRPWVRKYLQALARASETQLDTAQIPGDALQLAFLASHLLHNLSSEKKQDLLNTQSAPVLVDTLRQIYRREVTLLDAMLSPQIGEEVGPFSSN
jgi:uncharacterized protein